MSVATVMCDAGTTVPPREVAGRALAAAGFRRSAAGVWRRTPHAGTAPARGRIRGDWIVLDAQAALLRDVPAARIVASSADGDDASPVSVLGATIAWALGAATDPAARDDDGPWPFDDDDFDGALRAGAHLDRVIVDRTDGSVVLTAPLATVRGDLPSARVDAIAAVLDAAASLRVVRIARTDLGADRGTRLDAIVDLTGAPRSARPGLTVVALAALRLAYAWLAPTLRVLTDSSVRITLLDASSGAARTPSRS